jgi:hypothetical protein
VAGEQRNAAASDAGKEGQELSDHQSWQVTHFLSARLISGKISVEDSRNISRSKLMEGRFLDIMVISLIMLAQISCWRYGYES